MPTPARLSFGRADEEQGALAANAPTAGQRSALRLIHLHAFLRDLARHGGGYELRGVRGWATADDVGDATGVFGAGEELRIAVKRGDLIREDVSVPDAASPIWVYRITDHAARVVAELEGKEHVPIRPADDKAAGGCRAYLRPGVRAVLDALRHALDNSTARRARITGEPEWRTCRELTDWVREQSAQSGDERHFLSDDLTWAVNNGLVERRKLPAPRDSSTSAQVVVYRITVTGAAVQPLVWHEHENG